MYFVVYLLPSRQNVVIPKNWIREFDFHVEKFFNYGMNRSQKYVCFWTNNLAARDNGILRLDFQPDFTAPFSPTFPAEGLYMCQIRKAKANYHDGLKYAQRLRGPPAIYNVNRLFERPIPAIPELRRAIVLRTPRETPGPDRQLTERSDPIAIESSLPTVGSADDSAVQATDNQNDPIEANIEALEENSTEKSTVQDDQTTTEELTGRNSADLENLVGDAIPGCFHSGNQQSLSNAVTNVSPVEQPDTNETKPDIPILNLSIENTNELHNVLDEHHAEEEDDYDDDSDDVVMIYTPTFPRPFPIQSSNLTKREDDVISNNIPFDESENGRVYEIGNSRYVISYPVIETFRAWNLNGSERIDIGIDERFVQALLLVLVSRDSLAASDINADVLEFITGLMAIRSNNDPQRVSAVQTYVRLFCEAKKREAERSEVEKNEVESQKQTSNE